MKTPDKKTVASACFLNFFVASVITGSSVFLDLMIQDYPFLVANRRLMDQAGNDWTTRTPQWSPMKIRPSLSLSSLIRLTGNALFMVCPAKLKDAR